METIGPFYAILTLVTISGQPVIVNDQPQTEHYAKPYALYNECMFRAWEMAAAKTECRGQRPDRPCQVRWDATCSIEAPK